MAKLWDRNAALVLIPAIQPLGYNPSDYNINLASIRRQRIKSRKKLKGLKQEFKADVPPTIHWDEKLLEDIYGKETVDRLPILVFIEGVYQLLGVPSYRQAQEKQLVRLCTILRYSGGSVTK